MRRLLSLLLAAGALLAVPAGAAAATRDVPRPGPLPPGARIGAMHDVVSPPTRARLSRLQARAAGGTRYTSPDGYFVAVETSPAYPHDPAADQALVDFLGSRLHGPELGELRVYVGTPAEIAQSCGGDDAVACYDPSEQRMYVPGEASHGVPIEYAITHEYGHHIAAWQDNDPWLAVDWGTKRWASYTYVCANVVARRLFPGDEGSHYRQDPGEAFADSYAHYHYRSAPWYFSRILRPSAGAYRAIARDVRDPWSGPRRKVLRGRLGPGRPTQRFRVRLRLDGDLSLRLRGPRRSDFDVSVRWHRELIGRTRGHGSRDFAGIEWCRTRRAETATITVVRRRGAGSFELSARYAG